MAKRDNYKAFEKIFKGKGVVMYHPHTDTIIRGIVTDISPSANIGVLVLRVVTINGGDEYNIELKFENLLDIGEWQLV